MQPREKKGASPTKVQRHSRYHETHYTKRPVRCHSCEVVLLTTEYTYCLCCRGQLHLTGGRNENTHQ